VSKTRIDIEDLFITLFVGAILLPIAITQFTSTNTTGWPSTLVTIWDNLPVVGLAGVMVGLLYKVKRR